LRRNVQRSNELGQLVAYDQTSSIIYVPLLANTADGQPLNYSTLSDQLEALRDKYQNDRIDIHITGFAKKVGDLIDGLKQILLFFAVAIVITTAVLFWYTRCLRSTCWWCSARWWRWSGSSACCHCWAINWTRTRCWCRSWCSPSA
jgi:hypothetical protein